MKYTLDLSQRLISLALAEISKIHAIAWFLMAGYPIISSHPLPTVLWPESLFLMNSLWIPSKVRRSVDDGLSAF
jgi:hypothetical protein